MIRVNSLGQPDPPSLPRSKTKTAPTLEVFFLYKIFEKKNQNEGKTLFWTKMQKMQITLYLDNFLHLIKCKKPTPLTPTLPNIFQTDTLNTDLFCLITVLVLSKLKK